jgi:hypothetical protein
MGERGRKVREYWSGGLGGNFSICRVACVIITVYYGRLWCGERRILHLIRWKFHDFKFCRMQIISISLQHKIIYAYVRIETLDSDKTLD